MLKKKSRPMKTLEVNTSDTVKTVDKMGTYKRWFNGAKFFFTVKLLPPKK